MYVCMYVYCTYIGMYVCMYVCMFLCMFRTFSLCMIVCMLIFMYLISSLCMYVCLSLLTVRIKQVIECDLAAVTAVSMEDVSTLFSALDNAVDKLIHVGKSEVRVHPSHYSYPFML